jgi:hypothetical protein
LFRDQVCRRGVCCCEISHLDIIIIIIINMAFGAGRALTAPLAGINFILYLISIVLAGWAINKSIEGEYIGGNAATAFFLPLAIIAAVVGLASTLAGIYHLRVYRSDSLSAAHAVALIALLLTLLGLG